VSIAYRVYEEIYIDKEYFQKFSDFGRAMAEQLKATPSTTPPSQMLKEQEI